MHINAYTHKHLKYLTITIVLIRKDSHESCQQLNMLCNGNVCNASEHNKVDRQLSRSAVCNTTLSPSGRR